MNYYKYGPVRPHRQHAHIQSFGGTQLPNTWSTSYPYVNNSGYPGMGSFTGTGSMNIPYGTQQVTTPASGGSSGFSMDQFKNIFSRMGGLDGIIGTMGKVNKLVQGFQQMSPLLRLMMNSFLGGATAATSTDKSGRRRSRSRGYSRSRRRSYPRSSSRYRSGRGPRAYSSAPSRRRRSSTGRRPRPHARRR